MSTVELPQIRTIIGKNVKHLRKRDELTQQQLAEKVGIKQPSIAAIEAGDASPSIDTIAKVAEVFQVPPDMILRRDAFEAA